MNPIRSAKMLLRENGGKFLVLRRSGTHPRHPYYPDLPGGDIETGESFEMGLARELLEETGLTVDTAQARLLHASTAPHESGDSISHLLYLVTIDAHEPEVTISWEHDQHAWKTVEELMDFEEAFQAAINYAKQHEIL